jgi:hypothetical protein
MNQETIKELLRRQPFMPFKIKLPNGEVFEVRHPEFVLFSKTGLVVAYPDSNRLSICALLHIANIETMTPTQAL